MHVPIKKDNSAGFAAVEAVLIVVIIAVIGGVGAYVLKQNNAANHSLSSASHADNTAAIPVSAGTTASIDQLTQLDAQSETDAYTAGDTQTQTNTSDANSAVTNVGGAYDETSL